MGLEAATLIHELVVTNPVGATDPKSQGDDHIRLIKSAVKNTFPNINAAITVTDEEINRLTGVTANVELMRGLANSNQAMPYSMAAGDIGNCISTTSAGTLTLPNLADGFSAIVDVVGGQITVTSSSGTLSWFNGSGTILTGNRTVVIGGSFTVHRVAGNWRIKGGGIL